MVGHEPSSATGGLSTKLTALVLSGMMATGTAACSGGAPPPEPVVTPPTQRPLQPTLKPPAPRLSDPARKPQASKKPAKRESVSVVEIESEQPEEKDIQDLVAVAQRERAKRNAGSSTMPIAVINNENLEEYATSGELTYVDEAELQDEEATTQASPDTSSQEEYWRDQAAETRLAWKEIVDERQQLEDRAEDLRRRFYSEDDEFVRNGQIKPEWDRVLERLSETRVEEARYQSELEELYEQAQLAGADSAWVDEGIEFEPESQTDDTEATPGELRSHQVLDPPSVDGGEPL